MPTERQSESARINGAKSHGPTSAEGKKKSSRNSLRHGCTASHTIILACEDPEDFERMVEKYDTMYKPVTLAEQDPIPLRQSWIMLETKARPPVESAKRTPAAAKRLTRTSASTGGA